VNSAVTEMMFDSFYNLATVIHLRAHEEPV